MKWPRAAGDETILKKCILNVMSKYNNTTYVNYLVLSFNFEDDKFKLVVIFNIVISERYAQAKSYLPIVNFF